MTGFGPLPFGPTGLTPSPASGEGNNCASPPADSRYKVSAIQRAADALFGISPYCESFILQRNLNSGAALAPAFDFRFKRLVRSRFRLP